MRPVYKPGLNSSSTCGDVVQNLAGIDFVHFERQNVNDGKGMDYWGPSAVRLSCRIALIGAGSHQRPAGFQTYAGGSKTRRDRLNLDL